MRKIYLRCNKRREPPPPKRVPVDPFDPFDDSPVFKPSSAKFTPLSAPVTVWTEELINMYGVPGDQLQYADWTELTSEMRLTVGAYYYLTPSGKLTTKRPDQIGETIIEVGMALSSTRLLRT